MENEKALEILKSAILMEARGQAFYKNVAEQTKSEDVKNIFNIMASEEKLHAEYLSKQYSSIKNTGKPDHQTLPEVSDENVVNMILSPEIKNQISGAGYEAAAISASIDMENKAVEVYTEFANRSSDVSIKELFMWLADWEKGHVKILNELDNELKEKIWFDNNFWPF
ncbi:MAG: ferritin family protein [Bacteroidales bacterium]|jgi:rubrerythrin|nr:ferritin family protein [Bacteroidales bacterium]MDD4213611.1 ferritin family protein [Bacteroidales bacterium]